MISSSAHPGRHARSHHAHILTSYCTLSAYPPLYPLLLLLPRRLSAHQGTFSPRLPRARAAPSSRVVYAAGARASRAAPIALPNPGGAGPCTPDSAALGLLAVRWPCPSPRPTPFFPRPSFTLRALYSLVFLYFFFSLPSAGRFAHRARMRTSRAAPIVTWHVIAGSSGLILRCVIPPSASFLRHGTATRHRITGATRPFSAITRLRTRASAGSLLLRPLARLRQSIRAPRASYVMYRWGNRDP